MERLIKKYMELLSAPGDPAERFWALEKRIKTDRKHPGVIIELRKSEAIWDIAMFVREQVINLKDLDGFSQELIDSVNEILNR